jgi:hypothetical protein
MANAATIVAVILGALEIIEAWTGWKSGITEDWILSILAVLTGVFAWWGGRESHSH